MSRRVGTDRPWFRELAESIQQALAEFLAVPTAIILAFLALSAGTYLLDRAQPVWLAPLRILLQSYMFADPSATSAFLAVVAAGLITVASITISLLLLALQQSAANMTAQILDQFLRRRINQAYFGFFVGLALYSLVTLATINKPFNPIFGATLALLLTVAALYLLIILLYTTINQMRPVQIVETIHDHVLAARRYQLDLVRKTRRASCCNGATITRITAEGEGFVTKIDVNAIGKAARALPDGTEIVLEVEIGSYLAFHDLIATVKSETGHDAAAIAKTTHSAVLLERQRNIAADAGYGIQQLAMIGWTSISSAKSHVGSGLLSLHALRDIMARWSAEDSSAENKVVEGKDARGPAVWPIVYRDRAFEELLNAVESLAVISSESMQYQIFSEALRTCTTMYPRIPAEYRPRVEDLLLRILSVLGDHALTLELDIALSAVQQMLRSNNRLETASLIQQAHLELQRSVGKLNSRSTRATGATS